jgi:hypothetical protein
MLKKTLIPIAALLLIAGFIGCSDNSTTPTSTQPGGNLGLNISGLGDLGSAAQYEGWIIVSSSPISTGRFTVDSNGTLSKTSFSVDATDLSNASKFVLTIEPEPDPSPNPSGVKIIAGAFSGNTANLTIGDSSAIANDFMSSTGTFILATPTNGMNNNERSGVWFVDLMGGPHAGLNLPLLPPQWQYEGWVVVPGVSGALSTGKFTDPGAPDMAAPYSGSMAGPPFPGEDLLMNAPPGYTFPTDLRGGKFVITIEPNPDNSTSPFFLKPLRGTAPSDAIDHTNYPMDNIASSNSPTGTATR